MLVTKEVDIVPSPRILAVLGEINFENWQCIAELVDNAIDNLLKILALDPSFRAEVRVTIPTYAQFRNGAPITIWDNGTGMDENELVKAVRVGYSGNDPVNNLGLFGMGFNVATARMGTKTTVYTSKKGKTEEIGIEIDFQDMAKKGNFIRPLLTREKPFSESSGTTIKIHNLNERVQYLGQQGLPFLRKKLARFYTKLIRDYNISIYINDEKLQPVNKCIWNKDRYVVKNRENIYSYIEINKDLGPVYFCNNCWNWLDIPVNIHEPCCTICDSSVEVILRERVIKGWLGIQRYYDMEKYGIDFYRNGRLILADDKSLFSWVSPETGEEELEYPVDAIYLGGRIVGELEVNFLKVSYTKDSFDKGKHWNDMVRSIRGAGPLRPHIAKEKGFDENSSPLGLLYKGYKLGKNPGLQNLLPGKYDETKEKWNVDNVLPKTMSELFYKGHADYVDDNKWYELVLKAEEDKRSSKAGEGGSEGKSNTDNDPTDPNSDFFGDDNDNQDPFNGGNDEQDQQDTNQDGQGTEDKSDKADLFLEKDEVLSNVYKVEELEEEAIIVDVYKDYLLPEDKPLFLEKLSYSNYKAYYNPNNHLVKKYPNSIKEVLLMEIANYLFLRKNDTDEWPYSKIFYYLKNSYCQEEKIDCEFVKERISKLFSRIRKTISNLSLQNRNQQAFDLDKKDYQNLQRVVIKHLGEGDSRVKELIKTTEYLKYMPNTYLKTFFEEYPELFFDGKVWRMPFDEVNDELIKNELREEFGSYLQDVLWVMTRDNEELIENVVRLKRSINSLMILEGYTIEQ